MARFSGTFLLLAFASPLAAQVGYAPLNSPYRAIEHGVWIETYAGRMFGSGGTIPLGPRDGNIYGARMSFRSQKLVQLSVGLWLSTAQRNIIDANDSVATRIKPAIGQRLFAFETQLQLNLSGGKTWHGFAPYFGSGLGVVLGQSTPKADTSGYTFGTKMYFSPMVGTRYFVSDGIFLKGEVRASIWKIKYPASYSAEPIKQPGTFDNPNAVNTTGRGSSYALAPKLIFGIGWAF